MQRCPSCRWSPDDVTMHDLRGTYRSFGGRWRWTTEHLTEPELRAPGAAGGPTLLELGGDLLHLLTGATDRPGDGTTLRTALAAASADPEAGTHGGADDTLRHERAHEASHILTDAGRLVQALGRGTPHATGAVMAVHTSGGGVPKLPVDRAAISLRGLSGDRQKERRHHGRLWQAVSLWSVEVMERLRQEGHDVAPGSAGENLAVADVDWAAVRVGTRLRIGPDVVLEIASWAGPCKHIGHCFVGRDFHRIDHDRHPGWARAYASVRRDGEVRPGDEVVVEPPEERLATLPDAIGRRAG